MTTVKSLKPGDYARITVTHSGVVDHVEGGLVYWRSGAKISAVKVDKVKAPKPPAGTVLTGPEVENIWWRRGTLLRSSSSGSLLVLQADGTWRRLNDGAIWTFPQIAQSTASIWKTTYEVVFVA